MYRSPSRELGGPDLPAGDGEDAAGQGGRSFPFVGGEQDGGTSGAGLPDQAVEEVAMLGVEAGVGLVEQPQLRVPRHHGGEGGAPALAGREAPHGN
jgi:hypothetical protein